MILKVFFRRIYDRILKFLEEENRARTHPSVPSLQNADEYLLREKLKTTIMETKKYPLKVDCACFHVCE